MPSLLAEDVKTVVVDCEAVAWDVQQHKILPFQVILGVSQKSQDCCPAGSAFAGALEQAVVLCCVVVWELLFINQWYSGQPKKKLQV